MPIGIIFFLIAQQHLMTFSQISNVAVEASEGTEFYAFPVDGFANTMIVMNAMMNPIVSLAQTIQGAALTSTSSEPRRLLASRCNMIADLARGNYRGLNDPRMDEHTGRAIQ
jgi:hypothetical protein